MEKVGFIGACDKTNLIMYVAKALTWIEKKVLVVDTTMLQKTRYIVPSINPTKSYITNFENIDFAVGFENIQEIEKYLEVPKEKMPYDYMLIDIDSSRAIEEFEIQVLGTNYFVTAFDMYSLRKGLEIFENLSEPLKLTKILYKYNISEQDEEYLNYLSMDSKVNWKDVSIYLPNVNEDAQVLEENQKIYRIRIKKLSGAYQDGIICIVEDILKTKNTGRIKKSIKE